MKFLAVMLIALLLPATGLYAQTQAGDAQKAGEAWLGLVDQQDYGASWTAAALAFKQRISAENWTAAMTKVREPLGAVPVRKLVKISMTKSLPGMPDDDYTILQFQTSFAKKAEALETVTLMPDAGVPKVVGYFIK